MEMVKPDIVGTVANLRADRLDTADGSLQRPSAVGRGGVFDEAVGDHDPSSADRDMVTRGVDLGGDDVGRALIS